MRVWHKALIPYLDRERLVAQWRELSAIAGNILEKGTPNHILVNKVMDYPVNHLISYAYYIRKEMTYRKYRTMDKVWNKIASLNPNWTGEECCVSLNELFPDWHNKRYLTQCIYNLQEKYDCGNVSLETWTNIEDDLL